MWEMLEPELECGNECWGPGPPPEFLIPPPPRPPFLQELTSKCTEDPLPDIEMCEAIPVSTSILLHPFLQINLNYPFINIVLRFYFPAIFLIVPLTIFSCSRIFSRYKYIHNNKSLLYPIESCNYFRRVFYVRDICDVSRVFNYRLKSTILYWQYIYCTSA